MNAQLKQESSIVTALRPCVPWDEYLSLPGVSITRLKELGRSPQHFRHFLTHGRETPFLALGRAAHCAVLEPDRFDRDHAVWGGRTPSGNMAPRNSKKWDEFQSANSGRAILTEDEYREALGMQAAVRGSADAMRYLSRGAPEVTMQWEVAGRQAKGRLDWYTEDDGAPVLVGLKSARDCRERQFGRQAANLGYHLQWGYYYDGHKALTGKEAKVVEIVVESKPPHAVAVYVIPDEILQQGCDEYLVLLDRLAECERDNFWPGPVNGEQALSLPAWVYGDEEITYVE